jgi:DNA (cytosine-5)-methyltransferase 1
MYKRANDRKSHLLVNFLSWVDFLKPRFVFMENVRGFTTFRLNAMQYDKYRVGGGIEAGGLKFVHHALTQLGYQVRCGLLQAGHYGVPQTRVRSMICLYS